MGTTKKSIEFSKKHIGETNAAKKALQKVSEKLITETKKNKSYLVVSNGNGGAKKIPAKDL